MKRFLTFFKVISVIAVLLVLGASSGARADALQRTITIRKLASGEAVPTDARAILNAPSGVTGRLLHAFDTSYVGPKPLNWPWSLYLIFRRFPPQTAGDLTDVAFYKIETGSQDFVLQPRFAPDGEHLAFKIGDATSSFTTFRVSIYHLGTQTLETFDNIGYAPVSWSPNSRYLAYWYGGIPYPAGSVPGPPWELRIYDLQTHQRCSVVRNDRAFGKLVWTPDNCLLYNYLSSPRAREGSSPVALYRFNPRGRGKAVCILQDAIYPTPSPDGKWIAAYSFGKAAKDTGKRGKGTLPAAEIRKQRLLMLFPVGGGTPTLVNPRADYHRSSLLWASDCRRLYRITNRYKGEGKMQVRFYEYTLATGTEKEIVSLNYLVSRGREIYGPDPLFKPLNISHDGRFLYFTLVLDADKQPVKNRTLSDAYLKAVDLDTREVITICRVSEAGGLDWHDESSPALVRPAVQNAEPDSPQRAR